MGDVQRAALIGFVERSRFEIVPCRGVGEHVLAHLSRTIKVTGTAWTAGRSECCDADDGDFVPKALDAVRDAPNIGSMEQQFQASDTLAAGWEGTASPGTQTIDRAAQLLVLVLMAERPPSLGELAHATELPKSTASRLLGALERQGLVAQDGARGGFSAGPVLLRFAQRGLVDRHLAELAQPHLHALAEASGETVNLAVPGALGVEHLAEVSGRHFLGTGRWVGRRVPYHCTAVGKVLLALGAAALPDGPLEALTAETVVDRGRLDAELAAVRREETAVAADELEVGLTAVAAPIRGERGDVVGALTISGPTMRLGPERLAELGPKLVVEARALSARLAKQSGHGRIDRGVTRDD